LPLAQVARNAHRGAEIVLGRTLPLEPFLAAAKTALKDSDAWDGFPLGDSTLHVKYYPAKNDLRITNSALNAETESDFDRSDALDESRAREVALGAFRELVKAEILSAEQYEDVQFKVGTTEFLMGTAAASATRRVVTQYRFLANRRLNGIAFMNAGFSVGVHVSGAISHLRFGGAVVHSTLAPVDSDLPTDSVRQGLNRSKPVLRELPLGGGGVFVSRFDGARAKHRFNTDFPAGKPDWSELRYFLPDAAQGPTLMEPLHVVSFANHYGNAVSRRQYVGYPVRDPGGKRVLISDPPDPDATGDPR
jgi:hypothetical protein